MALKLYHDSNSARNFYLDKASTIKNIPVMLINE